MTTKVALISGSSSGIGKACVETFLREGWRVAGVSRSQGIDFDPSFLGIPTDLLNESDVKIACDKILQKWGRIDAVVHSVGDIYEPLSISDMDWQRWQTTLNLCVGTAVNLVKHSFNSIGQSAGAYVFISSVAAQHVYPGIPDYCAAKAALSAFSRSVASELAPNRGRSNSVSPAVVNTALFQKSPYTVEQAAEWHKLGRIGEPREISELVEFLAGGKSSWITGRDFIIDGGMLL